jgi:phosphoglucomutase
MKHLFDFKAIQGLLNRSDFKMVFDAMYGAAGPYASAIFGHELGHKVLLKNCDPKPDFNGGHPDPNLECAKGLVEAMGLKTGHS